MKIDRNGIGDFNRDETADRVCDNCSGDMVGFKGGYLYTGEPKKVSLGGPSYAHKKKDARIKVHVGLFKEGVEGAESFDICGQCILKALYEAGKYLRQQTKESVEDRDNKRLAEINTKLDSDRQKIAEKEHGRDLPDGYWSPVRETKDSHAAASAAPESPGGCRIKQKIVWLPNDDLDTASTTAEKYGEVIKDNVRIQKQLEKVTAQKEEWRRLFSDYAIDHFDFHAKIDAAAEAMEDGAAMHHALEKVGLEKLAGLAKVQFDEMRTEFKEEIADAGQRAIDELDERYLEDIKYFKDFHAKVDRVKRLVENQECSLDTALGIEGLTVLARLAEDQLNDFHSKIGRKEDYFYRNVRKLEDQNRHLQRRVKDLECGDGNRSLVEKLNRDITELERDRAIVKRAFEIAWQYVPSNMGKDYFITKAREQINGGEDLPF